MSEKIKDIIRNCNLGIIFVAIALSLTFYIFRAIDLMNYYLEYGASLFLIDFLIILVSVLIVLILIFFVVKKELNMKFSFLIVTLLLIYYLKHFFYSIYLDALNLRTVQGFVVFLTLMTVILTSSWVYVKNKK